MKFEVKTYSNDKLQNTFVFDLSNKIEAQGFCSVIELASIGGQTIKVNQIN